MGESSTCARCEGGILIQVVHWLITANPGNKFREFYVTFQLHYQCKFDGFQSSQTQNKDQKKGSIFFKH